MSAIPVTGGCVYLGSTWQLGKTKALEIVTTVPDDAIVSWQDSIQTYCLRERPVSVLSGNSKQDQILEARNGVWKIGEAYVKCSPIRGKGPAEYENIRWLQTHAPSIPVPEIIYAWTDLEIGHFMITKAVPGKTILDAFPSLSATDLEVITDQIAAHMATLARFTSPHMTRFGGNMFRDDRLAEYAPPSFTKPAAAEGFPTPFQPSFTTATYPPFIKAVTGLDCPPLGDGFVLTHSDLTPRNVVVAPRSPQGSQSEQSDATEARSPSIVVTAIIDWELLSYEPRWYPASYWPFYYEGPRNILDWDYALKRRYRAHGFPDYSEWIERFETKRAAIERDWLDECFKYCEWPDLKFYPPVRGMVGYRWDLDDGADAKAYVAAVKAEQEKELGKD